MSEFGFPLDASLLPALHALLEERHVSRAAARLGVSQSSLSHRLRQLRELLNDPLLVRGAHGYVLTPRAAMMQESLAQAVQLLRQAIAAPAQFSPGEFDGRIVLVMPDLLAPLFPDLLARLRADAPRAKYIVRMVSGELESELEQESCAVAVAPAHFAEEGSAQGLRSRNLGSLCFGVVARAGHPAARRMTLKRWLEAQHVVVSVGQRGQNPIDSYLQKQGYVRQIGLHVPHFLAGLQVVAHSDMLMNVPLALVTRVAQNWGLVTRAAPLELPEIRLAMLWHERLHVDPSHRWLRETVHTFLSAALTDGVGGAAIGHKKGNR